eukprot:29613-Eustigmatos_ZCMA.PRE.1
MVHSALDRSRRPCGFRLRCLAREAGRRMGVGGAWAGLLLFPMEICAADPCRALTGGLVAA